MIMRRIRLWSYLSSENKKAHRGRYSCEFQVNHPETRITNQYLKALFFYIIFKLVR